MWEEELTFSMSRQQFSTGGWEVAIDVWGSGGLCAPQGVCAARVDWTREPQLLLCCGTDGKIGGSVRLMKQLPVMGAMGLDLQTVIPAGTYVSAASLIVLSPTRGPLFVGDATPTLCTQGSLTDPRSLVPDPSSARRFLVLDTARSAMYGVCLNGSMELLGRSACTPLAVVRHSPSLLAVAVAV